MQNLTITVENRSYPVLILPGRPKALLDKTVALIYGVQTKHINQAISRNPNKFPSDFYFELTIEEIKYLREVTICDLDWKGGHLPKALTHLGCNMIATILKAETATRRAVQIIRSFTELESVRISSIDEIREMMRLQNQVIIAINNQLHEMGIKHNKEIQTILSRIHQLENRLLLTNNEQKKEVEVETISSAQANQLRECMNGKNLKRSQKMQLWAKFKKRFAIQRYVDLPKMQFQVALMWLEKQ